MAEVSVPPVRAQSPTQAVAKASPADEATSHGLAQNGLNVDESKSEMNGLEQQVEGLSTSNEHGEVASDEEQQHSAASTDFELHRACAEGDIEGVKRVLSRGLEPLETLGESSFSALALHAMILFGFSTKT